MLCIHLQSIYLHTKFNAIIESIIVVHIYWNKYAVCLVSIVLKVECTFSNHSIPFAKHFVRFDYIFYYYRQYVLFFLIQYDLSAKLKKRKEKLIDLLSFYFILTWLNWAAAAAAWKFFVTKSSDDTGKYGALTGGVL